MLTVPVLRGDGIGPEIVESTIQVIGEACARVGLDVAFDELPCGLSALAKWGTTMPGESLERLDASSGWILGPLSTHLYTGDRHPNVSALLRRRYELYANIRPARRMLRLGRDRGDDGSLDMVIVRENTEGFYADRNVVAGKGEFLPVEDVAIAVRVVTRRASRRVAEVAFELAQAPDRHGIVTAVHKANVLRLTDGLFLECCEEVASQHQHVLFNDLHVDAAATLMITEPSRFDVMVTTNMFGDILSNEAAGLVGGLGLAPSLNQGLDKAMAQASHGSAPHLAGSGRANPIAEILSGQMLLAWLARRHDDSRLRLVADAIGRAVGTVLGEGRLDLLTPDLGGTGTTRSVTDAVVAAL